MTHVPSPWCHSVALVSVPSCRSCFGPAHACIDPCLSLRQASWPVLKRFWLTVSCHQLALCFCLLSWLQPPTPGPVGCPRVSPQCESLFVRRGMLRGLGSASAWTSLAVLGVALFLTTTGANWVRALRADLQLATLCFDSCSGRTSRCAARLAMAMGGRLGF